MFFHESYTFPSRNMAWAYEYLGSTQGLNFGALIYRPNSGLRCPCIYFLDIVQIADVLNNLLWRVKFLLWTVYDPTQIT